MAIEVYREELESMVSKGAELVDVREVVEGNNALPGHKHVPLSRIGELAQSIARDRPTIFYCRSGLMSFQAAQIASSWTDQPLYYLSGGLLGFASYQDA